MKLAVAFVFALLLCATATAGKPSANTERVQVAKKLNRALARTPMRTTGYQLEAAGHRYRIHPAFIAAIAGTESSFGAAACSNNRFNAFGLASCGYGWRVPYFRSWKHAYMFMGRFLTSRWPGASTPYSYHGYAANSSAWGRRTAYWMQRLGFSPNVRYP